MNISFGPELGMGIWSEIRTPALPLQTELMAREINTSTVEVIAIRTRAADFY